MGNLFAGPHLWIILIIILLLFGAAKLPALAKSLGQSARVFKGEMKAMKEDDAPAGDTAAGATDAPATGSTAPAAEKPSEQDAPPRSA
ncbi:twin-arginine translocase TatA/TatE family subunit [Microbacterium istanbulense]|uniref:Sec-independent protein translocase protein TatA n=1 Tax=Microbacterium istanbulense TaxID=3122049 RepID=A0ABU8LPN5_9MICO